MKTERGPFSVSGSAPFTQFGEREAPRLIGEEDMRGDERERERGSFLKDGARETEKGRERENGGLGGCRPKEPK